MPSTWKNRLSNYRQKRNFRLNRAPTHVPDPQDPRGRITKKPTHIFFDRDPMSRFVDSRAHEVEKLLDEDITGLRAYEAPQLVCPLKFELVRSASHLKISDFNACLQLVEQTSGNDYRQSSIGWRPAEKKLEMTDKEMIYLLIRQGDVAAATEQKTADEPGESDADANTQPFPQASALDQLVEGYASDSDMEDFASDSDMKDSIASESTIKPDFHSGLFDAHTSDSDMDDSIASESTIIPDYRSELFDAQPSEDGVASDAHGSAASESTIKLDNFAIPLGPQPYKAASACASEGSVTSESTIVPDEPSVPFGPQPPKNMVWPDPADTGRILGFVSFMFTHDDPPHKDREVVYIYEIHLHSKLRGHGLGSNLIKFVELAADHCGVSKVMLTVFLANASAKALYEKLGYTKDECSPKDRVTRRKIIEADYLIMSKKIPHVFS